MSAEVLVAAVPELAERFARWTEEAAREAVAARGAFSIAVPGGSAAESLFPRLVEAPVDWSRTDVFFVDERAVPPSSPDSNVRLARSLWLDAVGVPAHRIHAMDGAAADTAAAAAAYADVLAACLAEPPRIDLVLLGVGPDGHVASLFPGHRLLRAWDRDVAAVDDAPKPPPRRITLTLRVLTAARRIVVFATGASKAAAVGAVLHGEESDLPLALATMGAGTIAWLLDPEAAGAP
jgi:6-phosphogluconolactonase